MCVVSAKPLTSCCFFCCITPESGQFDPDFAPHTHHAEPDSQVLTYRGTTENVCHIVLCQSILAFTAPLFHYHSICPPTGPARHTHLFFLSICCHKIKLLSPSTCFTPFYASSNTILAHTVHTLNSSHIQLCFQIIFTQAKYFYVDICDPQNGARLLPLYSL